MQARGRLGNALPIVIEGGDDWEEAAEELDSMFLGDAEVWYAPGQFAHCTAILVEVGMHDTLLSRLP